MKKILFMFLLVTFGVALTSCEDDNYFETASRVDITYNGVTEGTRKEDGTMDSATVKKADVTESVIVNPKRVAVFDMGILDTLDNLGISDLGINKLGLPTSSASGNLSKYNDTTKYSNIGTLFTASDEELVKLDPHVVFISGRSVNLRPVLKEILPKASIVQLNMPQDKFFETVYENLDILKKVFDGAATKIDTLKTSIQAKETDTKAKIAALEVKNALFMQVSGNSLSVYLNTGRFAAIFELGFGASLTSEEKEILDTAHGSTVSPEYVLEINPDYIFILDRGQATGGTGTVDETIATFSNEVNAKKNNKIVKVDPFSWYIAPGGANSVIKMIDDINSVLA